MGAIASPATKQKIAEIELERIFSLLTLKKHFMVEWNV
jgi:hypothetical protein